MVLFIIIVVCGLHTHTHTQTNKQTNTHTHTNTQLHRGRQDTHNQDTIHKIHIAAKNRIQERTPP
jgi:hypothetical protein